MGKKKQTNVNVDGASEQATAQTEVAVQAEVQPANESPADAQTDATADASDTPAATTKKGKKAKGDLTLADLAERYSAKMERDEKSAGTIASYGMELKTAIAELGAETKIANLTSSDVVVYFGCARVTKLKSGKPKSQLSIDKTRRVLRLALVWAVEAKLIAKAPLPEAIATH